MGNDVEASIIKWLFKGTWREGGNCDARREVEQVEEVTCGYFNGLEFRYRWETLEALQYAHKYSVVIIRIHGFSSNVQAGFKWLFKGTRW